jgi:hypothetical protein
MKDEQPHKVKQMQTAPTAIFFMIENPRNPEWIDRSQNFLNRPKFDRLANGPRGRCCQCLAW